MERNFAPSAEVIDLADIFRSIKNGWITITTFALLGIAVAVGVLVLVPPSFAGRASVVLKSANSAAPSSSLSDAIGAIAGAAGGGGGGGGVFAGLKSGVETEIEILLSRALAADVVDSLQLQIVVAKPRATPATHFVIATSLPGSFRRRTYEFTEIKGTSAPRTYRFKFAGDSGTAVIGQPAKLAIGTVTIAASAPAGQFKLAINDKEDAVTRVLENLSVDKLKSEVAHIDYRGDDSVSAARVPNLLMALYFDRRKGVDRGTNQKRAEFLAAKVDSEGKALALAERELREQRESSGVIDPLATGRLELDNENRLRAQLTDIKVQEGALQQLVTQIKNGTATPRQLAAYPQYIGNAAIINVVNSLISVESERQGALKTVTEEDPTVKALTERARVLDGQLMPMAQTTLDALTSERTSIQSRLTAIETSLVGLPRAAESYGRLEREILDRGRIYAALQTQLVDARLAAIGEGGDVRVLDPAAVPKKPAFPKKTVTVAAGFGGGLVIGVFAAILLGVIGGSMHDAQDVERRMGLPAVRLEYSAPLLVGGQASHTVLIVPVNDRARATPVAQRLVETAISRGLTSTVLDLSRGDLGAMVAETPGAAKLVTARGGNGDRFDANGAIARLEETHDLVVVQLPKLASHVAGAVLNSSRPVLLVTPERHIGRSDLQGAINLLRRVGAPVAGVVLNGDDRRNLRA